MGAPHHDADNGDGPQLIFDWNSGGRIRWGGLLALMVVAGLFVLMVLAIRVRMSLPVAWAVPQAEVIFLSNDTEVGRLLARRAVTRGPFPSRFEPSAWSGFEHAESEVLAATRTPRAQYDPELWPFPQADTEQEQLAPRGEPVLPERTLGPLKGPDVGALVRVPVLVPVSGWRDGDLQLPLPAFKAAVDDATAARALRFMLKVGASGRVRECIALAGVAEPGVAAIGDWLKRLVFAGGEGERWISLSVGFKNQVGNDGTGTD